MKCQYCDATATVHLTTLENNKKKEMHLCQECAEEHEVLQGQEQQLNLPTIVQTLLGQHVDAETDALARQTCPHCGIRYMELRSEGRLGCPHDYEVFQTGLQRMLKRIHRSVTHKGKVPVHHQHSLAQQRQLTELREQLTEAIQREAYEEAALIRDLLREKDTTYESG